MKRIIVSALFSLIGGVGLFAQEFGVGGRIGLTESTLDVETSLQHRFLFNEGWHVDVYAYKMVNSFVGIEGGAMIIQTGYVMDYQAIGDLIVDPVNTKITYFSIPVSARFKFANFKRNPGGYFTFNPGVRPSFLLHSDQENARQGFDLQRQLSDYDVSVFLTPGVQFPNGVSITSTFAYGLRNTIQDSDENKSKSFVLQFTIGYTFYKKGGSE